MPHLDDNDDDDDNATSINAACYIILYYAGVCVRGMVRTCAVRSSDKRRAERVIRTTLRVTATAGPFGDKKDCVIHPAAAVVGVTLVGAHRRRSPSGAVGGGI